MAVRQEPYSGLDKGGYRKASVGKTRTCDPEGSLDLGVAAFPCRKYDTCVEGVNVVWVLGKRRFRVSMKKVKPGMCVSQLAKHWDRASSDEAAVASVGVVWRASSLEGRLYAGRTRFCHARHWTGTAPRAEAGRKDVRPIVVVAQPNPTSQGPAAVPLPRLPPASNLGPVFTSVNTLRERGIVRNAS